MDKHIQVFKPMDVMLTCKMSAHDWAVMSDLVFEIIEEPLDQGKLADIFMALPDDIKGSVFSYGISDTEVKDRIYEWLKKTEGEKW